MMMKIEHIYSGNEVLIVNTTTGELLATYAAHSNKPNKPSKYKPVCPYTAKDEDEVLESARYYEVTKKKSYEWIDVFRKEELWAHKEYGVKKTLTKPVVNLLNTLVEGIDVFNVIVVKRTTLCEVLNVPNSNLNKKLNTLESKGLIRTSSKDVRKGHIRIVLHPQLAFRGEWSSKWRATQDWIRGVMEPSTELYTHREMLIVPQIHVVYDYTDEDEWEVEKVRQGKVHSSHLATIMAMTNKEFKQWLSAVL